MTEMNSRHRKSVSLEDIIGVASGFGFFISFFLLLATYGGVECDAISLNTGIVLAIICLFVLFVSVIGINKIEKGDGDKYDRL